MQILNNNKLIIPGNKFIHNDNKDKKYIDSGSKSFQDILSKKIDAKNDGISVQFSKHASMRLNDRNLSLSGEQLKRIENGVEQAESKGIKDSLIIVDDIALVVNVKNKVVVTALNSGKDGKNIFTNIDGAVIV